MMTGVAAPLKLLDERMRQRHLHWVAAFAGIIMFLIYSVRLSHNF